MENLDLELKQLLRQEKLSKNAYYTSCQRLNLDPGHKCQRKTARIK